MLITDYFNKASSGTRAEPTTLSSQKAVAATSINCSALNGWPVDTPVHFQLYTTTIVNGVATVTPGSQTDWKGIVSGSTITQLTLKAGTDMIYSIGTVVVALPTAAWANDFVTGVSTSLDQDGTLKSGAVDNLSVLAASVLSAIYPIGSIYTNATNATNPSSLMGFGTWTAFGTGRVPVGYDASQTEFNASEKTGGDKNMQQHSHSITDPGHYHQERVATTGGSGTGISGTANVIGNAGATQDTGNAFTAITILNAGTGTAGNLQPYITVYMWKRTA